MTTQTQVSTQDLKQDKIILSGKRIYISGQISGRRKKVAKRQFDEMELLLCAEGAKVINPLSLDYPWRRMQWIDYMEQDINALKECDAIVMLEGWHKSKGARIERTVAEILGIEIIAGSSIVTELQLKHATKWLLSKRPLRDVIFLRALRRKRG